MRILMETAKAAAVAAALIVLWGGPALAQWNEHIQPQEEEEPAPKPEPIEDNPRWDKYAFDLAYVGEPGNLTFHELARTGEPFVLFFWLAECPVCHMQMPYIQDLYDTIAEHELGVDVVIISLDFRASDAQEMIDEREITIPALIDPRARQTDDTYKLSDVGTPIAYVFDAKGLLAGEISGFKSGIAKEIFKLLKIDLPKD